MLPYILIFIISNILIYFGEKKLKNHKKVGIIILILAVFPLILLCGLRTIDLGWDTKKYLLSIFNHISGRDFSSFITYMNLRGTEKGFMFIVYILTKISNNMNFVMIMLNLFVTYSVLYFAYKNKEKYNTSILFTMILYETTLYSITFSTLRQCLSLALTFVIYIFFKEKKWISCILLFILSGFFHRSAPLIIILLLISIINDSKKISKKHINAINIFLIIFTILAVLFYEPVMMYLGNIGILPERYVGYLDSKYNSEIIIVRWPFFMFKLLNVILGILYFRNKKISVEEKNENRKWFIMIIIDFIFTILSFKILNVHRMSYYLLYPALFAFIPQTIRIFKEDRDNKTLAYSLLSIIYFAYFIMSLEYYGIYPYKGILR